MGVATQHCERQAGGAGDVGVGEPGVAVLLDLERLRPALLDRIAQAVQRADAGIAAPREHELSGAAHADQLVVDQVRRHPDQRQILPALADHLVAGRMGDQVRESLQGDSIAVLQQLGDGLPEREQLCHHATSPSGSSAHTSKNTVSSGPCMCRSSR
jgi:hypothetical protein